MLYYVSYPKPGLTALCLLGLSPRAKPTSRDVIGDPGEAEMEVWENRSKTWWGLRWPSLNRCIRSTTEIYFGKVYDPQIELVCDAWVWNRGWECAAARTALAADEHITKSRTRGIARGCSFALAKFTSVIKSDGSIEKEV